jgi:hypothetical protein
LRDQKARFQVHVDVFVLIARGDFFEGLRTGDAGIVDQDGDSAQLISGPLRTFGPVF